jgi:biotin carboxyl carrier protein
MIYEVTINERIYSVELARSGPGWHCKIDGREFPLDVVELQNNMLSVLVQGESYEVKQESTAAETSIIIGRERFVATVRDPRSLRSRRRANGAGAGPRKITAPMPGKVLRILVPAGNAVQAGQGVLVIEAMKMQNELKSPKDGRVKKLNVGEGALVEAGQVLAEVE